MSCKCIEGESTCMCCEYKRGFTGRTGQRGPQADPLDPIPGPVGATGIPGKRGAPGVGVIGKPGKDGNANEQAIIDAIKGSIDSSWLNAQLQDDWSQFDQFPLLFNIQQETNDEIAKIKGAAVWEPTIAYPAGTYVKFEDKIYRALIDVPPGIPVTNTTFWKDVGAYYDGGENIEAIRVRLDTLDLDASNKTIRLNKLETDLLRVDRNSAENTRNLTIVVDEQAAQASELRRLGVSVNTIDGKVETQIEENRTAFANIDGKFGALYTLSAKATANGQTYVAGIAIGVEGSGGTVLSQILFDAQRIAFIDSSSGSTLYPFVVENNIVYMNMARIKNLVVDTIDIKNGAVTTTAYSSYNYDNGVYGNNLDQQFNISLTTYPHTYLLTQARIQVPQGVSGLVLHFSVDCLNGRVIHNFDSEVLYENTGNVFVVVKTWAPTNSGTTPVASYLIPQTVPSRVNPIPLVGFTWVEPNPVPGDWYYTVAIRGVEAPAIRNNTSWRRPRMYVQVAKR